MPQGSVQVWCEEDSRRRISLEAERIRKGDRAAFSDLFHRHYDALCRYAVRYVDSIEIAEDLVQDVYFDLWRRRAAWDPTHSARAFLYGAVRNQVLNYQRRLRTRRLTDEPELLDALEADEDPEEMIHFKEIARATERAIEELPPRCRHVFILSREHDLTYAEIASTLDLSLKTVETHMGRALKHLRDRLALLRR